MYELCTGYENDYTGLCTSWKLWSIMVKLWASSTVIEDYEDNQQILKISNILEVVEILF